MDTVAQETAKQISKAGSNYEGVVAAYSGAGSNLIQQGLQHFNSVKRYEDVDQGSGRQIAAQTIQAGFKYLVQGINSAPDVQSKANATIQLLGEIDYIAKFQPRLAQQIEYYYFGPQGSEIQPLEPKKTFTNWLIGAVPFDPYTTRKIYRSKKK